MRCASGVQGLEGRALQPGTQTFTSPRVGEAKTAVASDVIGVVWGLQGGYYQVSETPMGEGGAQPVPPVTVVQRVASAGNLKDTQWYKG